MDAAGALPELQRRFMAALFDDDEPGPIDGIAGNGIAPAARLRIYRRSCAEIQIGALRTTYPAVFALVGEAYFEQTARGYRRKHPSGSGNLQTFGAHFADYIEALPEAGALPYLGGVTRLEWLRQSTALAAEADSLTPVDFDNAVVHLKDAYRIALHPSVHLFASPHPALTIWRYALHPTPERLGLAGDGENIVLWREDGEVAMAAIDAASFACIEALARGCTFDAAYAAARALDAGFDFSGCMASLVERGLFVTLIECGAAQENATCR